MLHLIKKTNLLMMLIIMFVTSLSMTSVYASEQSYSLRFVAGLEGGNDNSVAVSSYIIGGDNSERNYPWMVALYQSGGFICGGVLISSNWIATAAHCVYHTDDDNGDAIAYDASTYSVVIGESTRYATTNLARRAGVEVHDLNNIVIQPNYDSDSYDYDIALLELETPYYQPGPAIVTTERFELLNEDDLLTVIGFGLTSAESTETSPILQEAELPYVNTRNCYWDRFGLLSDNMFCAGYESEDINIASCSGDSGGPIFATLEGQLTLVGLVSWGTATCSDVPEVYTNLSNLRSWIFQNINGFQVVEEGSAVYDSDEQSYSSGLVSIYQYGTESDNFVSIGALTFDDDTYSETLSLDNNCSWNVVSASEEGIAKCDIDFDLMEIINQDLLFFATLIVDNEDVLVQEIIEESIIEEEEFTEEQISTSTENEIVDDASTDLEEAGSTADSNNETGGSLSFSLLILLLLYGFRVREAKP